MPTVDDVVSLDRQGDIALICVDYPPVNALSSTVIDGLERALSAFILDRHLKIAVLYCQGRGFIAGADLKETPSTARSDRAAKMVNSIAGCSKPLLAAIHGSALGGGLEVAIACDYRCATQDARCGLPEVNIGAIPGYGGTQRLPRLVGLQKALTIMVSGQTLDASEAQEAGLLDRVFTAGELLPQAVEFADELLATGAKARKTDSLDVAGRDQVDALCESALTQACQTRAGEDAPKLIIECARQAALLPIAEGLAYERGVSVSRLDAPQCLAMRHLLFAEIAARKSPGTMPLAREVSDRMLKVMLENLQRLAADDDARNAVLVAFRIFGWQQGPFAHWQSGVPAELADQKVQPAWPIAHAALSALVNEGLKAVSEYAELRTEDLDAVFCQQHGFPRYRGGPMFYYSLDPELATCRSEPLLKSYNREVTS